MTPPEPVDEDALADARGLWLFVREPNCDPPGPSVTLPAWLTGSPSSVFATITAAPAESLEAMQNILDEAGLGVPGRRHVAAMRTRRRTTTR